MIVRISTKSVLDGIKLWVHLSNIRLEGTVSQIFVLGLSLYFMQKKTGNFLYIFLNIIFKIL